MFDELQQLNPSGDLASQFDPEKCSHHFIRRTNIGSLNLSVTLHTVPKEHSLRLVAMNRTSVPQVDGLSAHFLPGRL